MSNYRKNYGLFIAQPENDISIKMIQGASKAAKEVDANLFVFPIGLIEGQYADSSSNQYCYQSNILDCFFSVDSLDGIILEYGSIVSNLPEEKKKKFLNKIGKKPCVLLSEDADGFTSICFDNEAGLKEVIYHLVKDHGYQRIGFVSGPRDNHDAQQRLAVYEEIMKEYGLYQEDYVIYGNFSMYCKDMLMEYIETHPELEAIIFANDSMAFGGIEAMEALGLQPGRDLAITGFDNIHMAMMQKVPLTTVIADNAEIAYEAIQYLSRLLFAEEVQTPKKIVVPTRMVKRLSCGCKREILRDENGNTIMTADEREYRETVNNIVVDAMKMQNFMMELRYIQREMVYYTDFRIRWLSEIMRSLMVMGCTKCLLLFYDKPIEHIREKEWSLPSEISVTAISVYDWHELFELQEKIIQTNELFHNEYIVADTISELVTNATKEESVSARLSFERIDYENLSNMVGRTDMLVAPLFFRERQYGFIMAESDVSYFLYLYQMTMQIGNTLEMVQINRMNHEIQEELIKANQAKTQFLANMSHEIRTPINAIMGMNEMILRENENPDIATYAKDIKDASENLLSIVNDILDISKIEENKMVLVPVSYKLNGLVQNVVNQMSFRAQQKDLEIRTEIDENLPSILWGDDIRLRQILLNILSNAVKYTNEGYILLRVTGSVLDQTARINFAVKDTGIGIKEEDLEKLFEKFARIEEKRNRNIEGTGLGMNITQGLLKMMDSHLRVESVYNKGSTFSFEVEQKIIDTKPIREAKANITEESNKYQQKLLAPDARILVVDDNAMNRVLISRLLKKTKIQIEEAINGLQCVEKYEKACKDQPYDLIFLDHMMPVMDGMEAIAKIKEMKSYQKTPLPIIALTANAIVGVENEYLDAGFDAYLSKPINPNKLDEILIHFLPSEKVTRLD